MQQSVAITGATSGLGRALVAQFSKSSCAFVLHARNTQALAELSQELTNHGIEVTTVAGDLRTPETVQRLVTVFQKKKISTLINNAGEACPGLLFEALPAEVFESMLETNLRVPIELCRAAYTLFLSNGGGTIININSIVGYEAKSTRTAYSCSRFALRGFTEALALEADGKAIKVFGVYPSRIKTRPEYEFGMEPEFVAEKIFEHATHSRESALILDDRPEHVKRKT